MVEFWLAFAFSLITQVGFFCILDNMIVVCNKLKHDTWENDQMHVNVKDKIKIEEQNLPR